MSPSPVSKTLELPKYQWNRKSLSVLHNSIYVSEKIILLSNKQMFKEMELDITPPIYMASGSFLIVIYSMWITVPVR